MSKYTTEVRFICENYSGLSESNGYSNVDKIVANSRAKIFDFDYPIYDESYRSVIETKILKHYYTREICADTVGLWKLWLNTRMNEIMPYYNQLYKSALLEFNPLYDVDITTDHMVKNDGNRANDNTITNNGSSNNNSDNWNYYSDTPQGGLEGIETNTYLTNATHDTAESHTNYNETNTADLKETFTSTESYLEHVNGKRGGVTYSKMLEEYRQTFRNIDIEVIHSLDDLFFNLW